MENILSLTRLQDGKLTISKELEAVEEVVSVAIGVIEKRAPEYEITVQIPDNLLLVPMDAKLIDQVLVNLIDNAVKHTQPHNEIWVTVYEDKENNCAVFSVKDSGKGIAEGDLPKIFNMFYTTHGKDTDTQRGVGLGLTICESIVKAHGGTIKVQNRIPLYPEDVKYILSFFSTRLNSIGEYNGVGIEAVTIVLMLIGTTNFAVLMLVTQRKWKQVIRVSEIRFMFTLLVIFVPIIAFSLSNHLNMGLLESFRTASFDVVSAISTTGYSTMSYSSWPPVAIGILIVLMLIGGGMGSTAGGMKMTRVYLMIRLAMANIRKRISPSSNVEVPYYIKAQGRTAIDSELATDTTGFVSCYFVIFVIGSLILSVTANCGLTEAMFEFASSLGTVGLSIGLTGPATGAGTLVVEMVGMILGRLEIFIVILGFYSGFNIVKKSGRYSINIIVHI